MSADNQIAVLAHRDAFPGGSWEYAATVVGHPSDLQNPDFAFNYAKELARRKNVWFRGPGASGRAREMARLLVEEYRANGWVLEYEDILFVEISEADDSISCLTLPKKCT